MLTLAVARSETIAHKSAVSLQTRRVSSGPGSGQTFEEDRFRYCFSNVPRPQRCWTLGGAARHARKFQWRARSLQPVETRSSAGACSRYCVQRAPEANADDLVLASEKTYDGQAHLCFSR